MIMEPFDVYRSYLALKLHFTTDKYDVIKQKGRVRATKQAFFRRTDLYSIKKISNNYSDKEVINFLVANFVSGDKWGGIFDSDSKETYLGWKKRIESISYIYKNDLEKIFKHARKFSKNVDDIFISQEGQHPDIMKLYMRNDVSIETLVIMNKLNQFVHRNDELLSNDVMWPDISRLIKKYSPFLDVNIDKYKKLTREAYDGYFRT